MSAALKSYVPQPLPAGRGTPMKDPRVVPLPTPQVRVTSRGHASLKQPILLRPPTPSPALTLLHRLQAAASILTASLVTLSLVSYGASVYLDQQLSQATRQLGRLQRNEQQLATFSAVLKSHMGDQATHLAKDLQPPKPDQVIFLKPAPLRTNSTPTPSSQGSFLTQWLGHSPLGY
ncbi:MAG: hypothetical protein ACKO5P_10385 [Nodosilinea sp.]